jgi:predicted ester cyclase
MPVSKVGVMVGIFSLLMTACLVACAGEPGKLPSPKVTSLSANADPGATEAMLLPARRYYAFWNTGDEQYARQALAPDFVDLNLPDGRPQGPTGPLVASRQFRQAVQDLALSVERTWVVGDQVISHLHFSGHLSGTFSGRKGDGRVIAFDAIDIYTIKNDRIATNWHLEDNLTLMKQLGVVAP